jgi:vesicle-fusing ATPase
LPDKHGRLQILRIHTAKMRDNNFLEADVSLDDLAERTKNFSGAEIEGLVKSAASYAFDRQIDASNPTKPVDPSKVRVTKADFDNVRFPSPVQLFSRCDTRAVAWIEVVTLD